MGGNRAYVSILKRYLDQSTDMLAKVTERCPDELWVQSLNGSPFWQEVYHAVSGVDFWLREDYRDPVAFISDATPHLGTTSEASLSTKVLSEYLGETLDRVGRLIDGLDDSRLLEPGRGGKVTYCEEIVGQIGHVQYHVGECNSRLGSHGAKVVEWIDPD